MVLTLSGRVADPGWVDPGPKLEKDGSESDLRKNGSDSARQENPDLNLEKIIFITDPNFVKEKIGFGSNKIYIWIRPNYGSGSTTLQ